MKKRPTTKTLDALKPPLAKRYEVRDTISPGLIVRVSYTRTKVWTFTKRINGKMHRIKIGEYPALTLFRNSRGVSAHIA